MLRQYSSTLLVVGAAVALTLASSEASSERKNDFQIDGALVPTNEIRKGGPPRDGIPALDMPRFVAARDATYLRDKDRVLGASLNGASRAYPIRILNYHEIVNDVIEGEAVVITYCPLCGSGTMFLSTIDDRHFEFGVSGLLYNSDVLMYDRETNSLWSQLMSQAISGRMRGTRLQQLPVSHTSWREWKSRYPETEVLSNDTGYRRNYRVNPYPNYGSDGRLYFPVSHSSNEYRRKEAVMGFEVDGKFKAYPFKELRKSALSFDDEFSGTSIRVEFDNENETARILDESGNELPTTIAYWFAWYAFHPETDVYKAPRNAD